eukprot:GDKK01004991.1.p1 GENE.GDKK01004991.1~~GDKK01004991.1.p1  ORF type:complete len:175 (-),score=56.60 GDKK01004991.1:15-539(-)
MSNPFMPMGVPSSQKSSKSDKEEEGKKKTLFEKLQNYEIDALDERNRFDAMDQFTKYEHLADNDFLEQLNQESCVAFQKKIEEDRKIEEDFRREKEILLAKRESVKPVSSNSDEQPRKTLLSKLSTAKKRKIVENNQYQNAEEAVSHEVVKESEVTLPQLSKGLLGDYSSSDSE